MSKIKLGLLGILGLLVFFLNPPVVDALTKPYLITNVIPSRGLFDPGITFFINDFDLDYSSGKILLSQLIDGNGETIVDDGIKIKITHEDGTQSEFYYLYSMEYSTPCRGLHTLSPTDISSSFRPGRNKVHVELFDYCGFNFGSSSLYLVHIDTPTPTPTPVKTPVVFIPGIGGSELKIKNDTNWSQPNGHGGIFSHFYSEGDTAWLNLGQLSLPGSDDYFDILRMKSDGITPESDLETSGKFTFGSYDHLINLFGENNYILDKDFFVFFYDWRKDNTLTTELLDKKIQEIKSQTGSLKVDIVAHSMGGLIARKYISNPINAGNVRKLIVLGTPHLGTPEFLKNLMRGGCLKFEVGSFCLTVNSAEIKDVLQNLITGFELSPSKKYFDLYDNSDNNHLYPIDFVNGPSDYNQIKQLLTNLKFNTALFTPSELFHNLDNDLANTNGVETHIITGSGFNTVGQIVESEEKNFLGNKKIKKDQKMINGDGTVALFSASLQDQDRSKFLNGSAKVYYTKQNHQELVANGDAMNLVKSILNDSDQIPNGISSRPFSLKGSLFSVHSPVNIHIYDTSGNHTGPLSNGDFEANIPGSSYDTLDDAKFIWLPDDGQYQIKFEATDQGSFDFKIRDYKDDINDSTILYKDVPLTTKTTAETTFDTSQTQSPTLEIDEDGNGVNDLQIDPTSILTGVSSSDQTPPKTTINIQGDQGDQNWYRGDVRVELQSEDESSGSGVLKTEYSLDEGGETILNYTDPFTISKEGITKLRIKSIDKAGNEEDLQEIEIKIDKTPPEVKLQFNPSTLDIDILGSDNLTKTTPVNSIFGEATFKDLAGNFIKVHYEPKDRRKKEMISLVDVLYSTDLPNITNFPKNRIEVKYQLEASKIKNLDQKVVIKEEERLKSEYKSKDNMTNTISKQPNHPKTEIKKEGMELLFLTTKLGSLELGF